MGARIRSAGERHPSRRASSARREGPDGQARAPHLQGVQRKGQANQVTCLGLSAHVPITVLIAQGRFFWAAPLLAILGLLDAFDGSLARAAKTASPAGMVLDAFMDRLKETMMHTGAAYYLASRTPGLATLPALAHGCSLSARNGKITQASQLAERGFQVLRNGSEDEGRLMCQHLVDGAPD